MLRRYRGFLSQLEAQTNLITRQAMNAPSQSYFSSSPTNPPSIHHLPNPILNPPPLPLPKLTLQKVYKYPPSSNPPFWSTLTISFCNQTGVSTLKRTSSAATLSQWSSRTEPTTQNTTNAPTQSSISQAYVYNFKQEILRRRIFPQRPERFQRCEEHGCPAGCG